MLPVVLMAFGVTAAALQGAAFNEQKRFFTDVFRQVPELPRQARNNLHPPRVLCGMLVIPADPSIDPGIRVQPPTTADYKIKAVRPPVCAD